MDDRKSGLSMQRDLPREQTPPVAAVCSLLLANGKHGSGVFAFYGHFHRKICIVCNAVSEIFQLTHCIQPAFHYNNFSPTTKIPDRNGRKLWQNWHSWYPGEK
jgi:DNA gyrase/topoisomerase IV subunit B